jgi:hypothetical protein
MVRLLYTCTIMAAVAGIRIQAQEKWDGATVSRGIEVIEQCSGCHSAETDERKWARRSKVSFSGPSCVMARP